MPTPVPRDLLASLATIRYSFGDLALDAKDVGELPVICLSPKVRIGFALINLTLTRTWLATLHATLKNVSDTKLLCDFTEIARFALILRGSARNHFKSAMFASCVRISS